MPVLHACNNAWDFADDMKYAGVDRKLFTIKEMEKDDTIGVLRASLEDSLAPVLEEHNCTIEQATDIMPLLFRMNAASGSWVTQHRDAQAMRDHFALVDSWHNTNDGEHEFDVEGLEAVVVPLCVQPFFEEFMRDYLRSFPIPPDRPVTKKQFTVTTPQKKIYKADF